MATLLELGVSTGSWDSGLKKAGSSLQQFIDQTKKAGGDLTTASERTVSFVRAMGDMGTKAANTKGRLREITQTLTDLTAQYRSLSDEEKSSDFGRAMADSISQLTERAGEAKDAIADVGAAITAAASDTRAFDQISAGISFVTASFQTLQGGAQLLGIELGNNVEVIAKLQAAMAVTNGLTQIQNALQKQSALMQGVMAVQIKARTAAEALATKGTKAATVAQAAFNAVAKANPYVLLASVAIAAGAALLAFAGNADEATEAERQNQEQTEALRRVQEDFAQSMQNALGAAVGDTVSKFEMLQNEWLQLQSVGEQTKWINNNQASFNALGLSVRSVNDAYRVFVNQADDVVAALIAIAEAKALESVYQEQMKKYYGMKYFTDDTGGRTHENGGTYTRVSGNDRWIDSDKFAGSEWSKAGLQRGVHYETQWTGSGTVEKLTPAGEKALNQYRNNQAWNLHTSMLDTQWNLVERIRGDMNAKKAEVAQRTASLPWFSGGGGGGLGGYTNGRFNIGAGGGGGHGGGGGGSGTGGGNNTTQDKTEIEQNNTKIKKLEEEYVKASDERKTAIQGEIKALEDRNEEIKRLMEEAHGPKSGTPLNSIAYWEEEISKAKEKQDLTTNVYDYQYLQGMIDQYEQFIKDIKGEVEKEEIEVEIGFKGATNASISEWINQQQQALDNMQPGTEATTAYRNIIDAQTLQNVLNHAIANDITISPDTVEDLWDKIIGGEDIPDSVWTDLESTINDAIAETDIEPIKIEVDTGDIVPMAKQVKEGWQDAANAVQAVGSALQKVENPSLKIAGIVGQAIANIALGFSQSTAAGTVTAGGPFAWIAAIAAGIGTMLSTISTIKSVTAGYSEGGIIKGNTYSGDQIPGNGGSIGLNAGEVVLNRAQQGNLASALNGSGKMQLTASIGAEDIRLILTNNARRTGRGEYVTTKFR